jgi:2-polyprenyl-3-methyl-5-hydroxy-6-metoxy-1,4-benzoquinol methylase
MNTTQRHGHWENVYTTKAEQEVSWFQGNPAMSLDLIHASGVAKDDAIIDIGGGASHLVDALVDEGYRAITVLDLSEQALTTAKARLGPRASQVDWIAADITTWERDGVYDLWHVRAAFHFLTAPSDRDAYVERLTKALCPGGHAIISTFALDGPDRCSGLPVVRYDACPLVRRSGRHLN